MRTTTLALVLLTLAASACRPSEAEVLDHAVRAAAEDDQTPRLRRVWATAGDYAHPSPDGRLVTFVDWTTGDVAVHDLATGESRRITDKGTWTENGSWAEWPVFSPDGRRVVYSYGNVLTGDPFRYELRYVTLGDTTQHLLRAIDPREDWIAPLDWTERGILFTHYTSPDSSVLSILDPETGEVMVVEPAFGRSRGPTREARLSPDGRYVAYYHGGLKVRDLERGTTSDVTFPSTFLLDWAADGSGIVVHGIREGRSGLWLLPLSDGRSAGAPRLLRDGIPAVTQAGGRAGDAFYYTIPADAPRIHVASVDVAGGRLLSTPTALTSPMDGAAMFTAWSPDGSQLAYLLRPLHNQGMTRVMVRDAAGDAVRELAALQLERVTSLEWSADGQEILLLERSRTLSGVSVRDGSVRTIMEDVGDLATLSPDGRTLVAVVAHRTARDEPAVVAVDLASGTRRVLERLTTRGAGGLRFTRDGRGVAYVSGTEGGASELRLLSLDGGPSRVLTRVDHPRHLERGGGPLALSPDGRRVLVGGGEWEADDSHGLWIVDTQGGATRELDLPGFGGNQHFSLHPDGTRLAYIGGGVRSELWVLDRLEP